MRHQKDRHGNWVYFRGVKVHPSLYATAQVKASGLYVRVGGQNHKGHGTASALLIQWADGSCDWQILDNQVHNPVL